MVQNSIFLCDNGKHSRETMIAVLDESKGWKTFNVGEKREKYHIICLLTPLSVVPPCLHPKIVSTEGAWIIPSVFPIQCRFISAQGETVTKDDPVISQVQYSEAI